MEQKENKSKNEVYRMLPRVDELMKYQGIEMLIQKFGYQQVRGQIRNLVEKLRNKIQREENSGKSKQLIQQFLDEIKSDEILCRKLEKQLQEERWKIKSVYNGTGVILHTGLGRAPLGKMVTQRLLSVAEGYSNLEYDLEKGTRGDRCAHFEKHLCQITGAEAAIAVNNNAGAVLLVLSALSEGSEVIVSRGELVEIGGKFRIPDVMELSGAKLCETGTTNRTRLSDYESAVTEETGAFLKVHTSNYRIIGFTEEVQTRELCLLRERMNAEREKKICVIEDLGSGVLVNLEKYGLPHEPTVQETLQAGADVVTFSGDKLLGGPQAGIIAGKKQFIDKIRKHPMMRALRIDKFTAAALEAVLEIYQKEIGITTEIPVLEMLTRSKEVVKQKAINACEQFRRAVQRKELETKNQSMHKNKFVKFTVEESIAKVGGGALPMTDLQGYAVAVEPLQISVDELDRRMRSLEIPVIGRIHEGKLFLDMRTFSEEATEYLSGIFQSTEFFREGKMKE